MGRRRIRRLLGMLWLIDAVLQSQPQLFRAEWWHQELPQSVMGQPAPVSTSILWATGHLAGHAAVVNALVVLAEGAIGACLVSGRLERAAIAASVPLAAGVWWLGEGFGALPTGFAAFAAGAPGPAVYYPLIGLLAWPRRPLPLEPAEVAEPPVSFRSAAAAWTCLWLGGAILELPWRFPPARVLQANIEQAADGQPPWLAGIAHWAYQIVGAHPAMIPVIAAAAQAGIGLAVLSRRSRRWGLAAGVALSVLFWVAVQDLGAIPGGGATDVGAGPLLVLLGLALAGASSGPTQPVGTLRRCPQPAARTSKAPVGFGI